MVLGIRFGVIVVDKLYSYKDCDKCGSTKEGAFKYIPEKITIVEVVINKYGIVFVDKEGERYQDYMLYDSKKDAQKAADKANKEIKNENDKA